MGRLGRTAFIDKRINRTARMLNAIGDRDVSQENRDREARKRREATEAWRGFV